jgi:hypothetical protein
MGRPDWGIVSCDTCGEPYWFRSGEVARNRTTKIGIVQIAVLTRLGVT